MNFNLAYFLILNKTTGGVVGSPYSTTIWSSLTDLYLDEGNGKLYIGLTWDTSYFIIYDDMLKTFTTYYASSTIKLRSARYEIYTQR